MCHGPGVKSLSVPLRRWFLFDPIKKQEAGIMTRKTLIIIGGVVVLGGVGWMITRSPQKPASHSQTAKVKVTVKAHGNPVIHHHQATHEKRSVAQPLSLAASFQARAHQALPSGATPVAVPWQPHTAWVFVPQAIQGQLWWGSRQGTGSWHWVSEDLPGVLSSQFPQPIYDTLQWADDLHANEPGPNLPGTVQWNVITGRVGEPVAWTTQMLAANASPVGEKALALTIWLPSETGVFKGYYGIETLWDAQNQATGHGALLMLTASHTVP